MPAVAHIDLGEKRVGDTVDAIAFAITEVDGQPIDLTGLPIKAQFRQRHNGTLAHEATAGSGIALNGTNGFTIAPFNLAQAGDIDFDVQIIFAGNIVRTWFTGTLKGVKDITK